MPLTLAAPPQSPEKTMLLNKSQDEKLRHRVWKPPVTEPRDRKCQRKMLHRQYEMKNDEEFIPEVEPFVLISHMIM